MTDQLLARLLEWCRAEHQWLRDTIEALVRLESPSTDKAAVDRCGDEVGRLLASLGGTVTRMPGGARGDHVLATFAGGPGRVLVLGHFDTVWPVGQIARMPLHEADGRLYGPGIFDMKAGIGVGLLAMRALQALPLPDPPAVAMLFTTDEEIGSGTSRALIERTAAECGAVLVLEPSLPGGAAKTCRKGCGEFELVVHGIAAHAGVEPEKGASAIHELALQITAMTALQDLDRGISVNVGEIDGGSRPNVVADRARALIDVRVTTAADAARLDAAFRGLAPRVPGTRLEVTSAAWRPPLERTAEVVRLYELARDVARQLGRDLAEGATGGGSDGNFTAAIGVPTLDGLGPRGAGAHAMHEHVELDDLTWRAALVAGLVSRLGGLE
jgi:glutamate carboxypeptidase